MSSHKVPFEFYQSPLEQRCCKDTTGTLVVDRMGCVIPVDTTAGVAGLTLAEPTKAGIIATVVREAGTNNLVLTITNGCDASGHTQLTFGSVGAFVTLISLDLGGTKYWRVLSSEGVTFA